MNKRFFVFVILLALLGAGGWYIWTHLFLAKGSAENAMAPAMGGAPAMPVSVLELKRETIALTRSLPGRVSAFRQSQVRPQVNGIITKRLFEEGANVQKGDQLYQIDDARYKAALASAQADLTSARSNITSIQARASRYEELVKIDAVSHQEYDDVKAQLDQANAGVAVAKAAVDVAQVNLGYTKVYAPISGRIGRSLVTEGALVTANQEQALSIITQLDPVYVDMQQSGTEAMELQGQMGGQDAVPVSVFVGDNTVLAYPHEGALKFSEVTIDETTGSITLRAIVPNPDSVFLPGLFVRATIDVGEKEVLLVPQRAATRMPDGSLSVWIVDEGNKAQMRSVQVDSAYKDNWIVSSGMEAGDKIIVEGYQKIGPGAEVVPSPWVPPADMMEPPPEADLEKTDERK
ncbi:MAG: efflux RND transporter periplasmic adaptor subunit [Alphaproteobacteria bacterium]|nr:efflux RND transporter periplasmic adaptor subunit [Alphaproteobacteria bacterium]